ncbi:hypothetical protein [Halorientalis marina]|uniref:hypothetical protein n=1 Tax=Halorientalis marina TaxID=2931976 RepID=UPI001FF3582D|nr:hypothetical protein [Halorientalis marina]
MWTLVLCPVDGWRRYPRFRFDLETLSGLYRKTASDLGEERIVRLGFQIETEFDTCPVRRSVGVELETDDLLSSVARRAVGRLLRDDIVVGHELHCCRDPVRVVRIDQIEV